jgi:Domain of unknown function (DUF4279)
LPKHTKQEAVSMARHLFTVEFRVVSETLDPEMITCELGLKPCQTRRQGELRADGKIFTGMWAYSGYEESDGPYWETLEEGLAFVLDELWRRRQLIASYKSKAKLIWWCGHFQTSFDGGPTLSASLLSRLGEFGADLFIDNFFSEQPRQSRESQT